MSTRVFRQPYWPRAGKICSCWDSSSGVCLWRPAHAWLTRVEPCHVMSARNSQTSSRACATLTLTPPSSPVSRPFSCLGQVNYSFSDLSVHSHNYSTVSAALLRQFSRQAGLNALVHCFESIGAVLIYCSTETACRWLIRCCLVMNWLTVNCCHLQSDS